MGFLFPETFSWQHQFFFCTFLFQMISAISGPVVIFGSLFTMNAIKIRLNYCLYHLRPCDCFWIFTTLMQVLQLSLECSRHFEYLHIHDFTNVSDFIGGTIPEHLITPSFLELGLFSSLLELGSCPSSFLREIWLYMCRTWHRRYSLP